MDTYHVFIINPISFRREGEQEQIITEISGLFYNSGNGFYRIYISRFPWDATGFIRSFAKSMPENSILRVYAIGGDGILFDCLNGIMGMPNAELAAVPYGYINNFVKRFGNKAPFLDLKRQVYAPSVPIDVIRCGNKYGINCCIVGLEARAIISFEKAREFFYKERLARQWLYLRLGRLLFFLCNIFACFEKEFFSSQMEINIDGETYNGRYRSVNVFNSSYYGWLFHPVNASVDDGKLDVVAAKHANTFRTVVSLPHYLNGRQNMFPRMYSHKQGHKITVKSNTSQVVYLDELIFYGKEISLELLPRALRFVDPRRDPGSRI